MNTHGHIVFLTLREQLSLWAFMFVGCGGIVVSVALSQRHQPARPVSMKRLNALNVGFWLFVGLFLVWAIFFFGDTQRSGIAARVRLWICG